MSVRAGLLQLAFRLVRFDKILESRFIRPVRGANAVRPEKLPELHCDEWSFEGAAGYTFSPSSGKFCGHVFYLHGGAYVLEGIVFHRNFVRKLVRNYGLRVSYFDYPLAPENTWQSTVNSTFGAYQMLVQRYPDDHISLLGDSAGGGLALSILQQLHCGLLDSATDVSQRNMKTVLLSPWVDISLSNPEVVARESIDPVLTTKGLTEAGRSYAGNSDPQTPEASPLFGEMRNLGSVLILAGELEMLLPDCIALAHKMGTASGTNVEFREVEKMMHDWPLFPIPEANVTCAEIAKFLAG